MTRTVNRVYKDPNPSDDTSLPLRKFQAWRRSFGVLGLALSGYFLPPQWALFFACAFLMCFGLFNGIQAVIFNTLMAKVIPLRLRGRLTGFRNFAAGLTAAGVAYIGGKYFVEANAWGNGYATTFLVSFVLTSIGISMLMMVREPEPPEVRARSNFWLRLRQIPDLLRGDRELSRFYCCRRQAPTSSGVPSPINSATASSSSCPSVSGRSPLCC